MAGQTQVVSPPLCTSLAIDAIDTRRVKESWQTSLQVATPWEWMALCIGNDTPKITEMSRWTWCAGAISSTPGRAGLRLRSEIDFNGLLLYADM